MIFTEDGKEMGRFYRHTGNRVYADYDEISQYVIDALIATEDVRFEEHSGIDVRALGRAARLAVETEEERLSDLVPRALGELRHAILTTKIKAVKRRISQASAAADSDTLRDAMHELMELNALKAEFASFLGDRIVTPPHKS